MWAIYIMYTLYVIYNILHFNPCIGQPCFVCMLHERVSLNFHTSALFEVAR